MAEIKRIVRLTSGPRQTIKLGQTLARRLKPGTVLYLYGELGSGKTILTKGLCQGLAVRETVSSPSFVIMTEYHGRWPVVHLDLYRLLPTQVPALNMEEYVNPHNITIIEWADRLKRRLPGRAVVINIIITGRRTRKITIEDIRY